MTTELAKSQATLLEKVVIEGDLEKLSPAERLHYYSKVCESLGLNPLTRPFEYIKLQGRMTLYAKKDATEQLAALHSISIELSDGRTIDGVYVIKATAAKEGRSADATGAVPIENLKGEAKANALMKAETKASRRAVLRLVGLGWLDETEVDSVPGSTHVTVDQTTGEIAEARPDFELRDYQGESVGGLRQGLREGHLPPALNGDAKAGSVEALAAHMKTLGWEWETFETKVLGMTWGEWMKLGGDPGTAWRRFQNWQEEENDAD